MWSSSHLLGTSWLLVVVAVCFHLVDAQAFSIQDQEPQSVHLVYGKAAATTTTGGGSVSGSELNIVWWTKGPITSAIVFYSLVDERDNHLPIDQIGCSHDAIEKGFIGRQATRGKYIHRVLIGNLLPARRYCYEITSGHASSDIYDFRTPPATAATNGSFLIDGWSSNTDNNNDAAANLTAQLSAAMRTPPYVHTLVHLPQLTLSPYADRPEVMYERDLLDEYASLLGHVPLLPTLGGDVDQQLFAGMLPVPLGSGSGGGAGGGGSYSYSVDINGVHLLTYSTDLFSLNEIDHANLSAILGDEMAWMEADLRRANANRARVPWLVVLLPNLIRCVEVACAHDKLNALKQRVELLFYQYGVDIIFESHAAAFYERFYPLVHTLDKYTTSFNRADMPVRIVLPRAATTASQDMFQLESIENWSAYRFNLSENDCAYGRLDVVGSSVLNWTYIHTGDQRVIDSFQLVKQHDESSLPPVVGAGAGAGGRPRVKNNAAFRANTKTTNPNSGFDDSTSRKREGHPALILLAVCLSIVLAGTGLALVIFHVRRYCHRRNVKLVINSNYSNLIESEFDA